MKVAITGATGFVGSALVKRLQAAGDQVVVFTRQPQRAERLFPKSVFSQVEIVEYQPTQPGDWQQAIAGCDGVVNLAGEAIADGRWTDARKQEILQSRQLTTQNLVAAIQQANPRPSVLVNASAIGYYGTSETAAFDETSPAGQDFLAQVCQTWETAAQAVKECGTRLVILRVGIVLGAEGGVLAKMIPPFKIFAGGPLGTGQQWVSWIHREDLLNLILRSLSQPEMQGVYNATAPNPVRMAEFCQALGDQLQRPSWLPVPGFALEALLGDGAKAVLEGQQVLPKHTQSEGFQYEYPSLKQALLQILAGS